MRNYYTQFASHLQVKTTLHLHWWKLQLQLVERRGKLVASADSMKGIANEPPDWEGIRGLLEWPELEEDPGSGDGLSCRIQDQVVIAAGDDYRAVEAWAWLVQRYLRMFRSRQSFAFTWADLCDRDADFGYTGGAVFVTAQRIDYLNTHDWIKQKRKNHQKKPKSKARKT